MLDDYTINMSVNLSGVVMPVDPSVGISALTQSKSADLSGYDYLVQLLYGGSNMSEDMVQSLYEYKANLVNLSDGIYVSTTARQESTPFCSPNSLDQEQAQGEAGGKSGQET